MQNNDLNGMPPPTPIDEALLHRARRNVAWNICGPDPTALEILDAREILDMLGLIP